MPALGSSARALVLACSVLGCNAISGVDDLAFDLAPPDDDDSEVPCVEPVAGMQLSQDTALCSGSYGLPAEPGQAAVTIVGDGATITCLGTVIEGAGSDPFDAGPRSVGIRIAADGVSLLGCTMRGYGYGIAAIGVGNPTLRDVHADDNFHHPEAGWLPQNHPGLPYDIGGGGVLLENVSGGLVEGSSFGTSWDGIELRGTTGVQIRGNVAQFCSNAGALLLDSHDNVIDDNDFSWAIRGTGLEYPSSWYGVATHDSSGIIIEKGSSGNRIENNDARYGGNGIFVRDLFGLCPHDNVIAYNDVSFSPHNGLECWCDHHVFDGNISDASHFGLWAGGSDHAQIRNNHISNSIQDGISIQIGEGRHILIENNSLLGNGRMGVLLSGRTHQAGAIGDGGSLVANSSHILLQGNDFSNNIGNDVFVQSSRAVVLAANCGQPDVLFSTSESEPHLVINSCGAAGTRMPPTAALAALPTVTAGVSVTLDASASAPSRTGDILAYTWRVQPGGLVFAGGALPTPLVSEDSSPLDTIDLPIPLSGAGIYDVDVTVSDGSLAAMAERTLFVLPPVSAKRVGQTAAAWAFSCPAETCTTSLGDEGAGVEGNQVHVVSDALEDLVLFTPSDKNLAFDASLRTYLGLFLRASNANEGLEWQGNFPVVILANGSGTLRYDPDVNLLPRESTEWVYIRVPLAGDEGWQRSGDDAVLSSVDWIELRMNTYGAGFEVWIDVLSIY
jgi:parallel beta-helix repeat protein